MSLYNNIRVSGAGLDAVNALYRPDGEINNGPTWTKVGGVRALDGFVTIGGGVWRLQSGSGKAYISDDPVPRATPWEVVTWIVDVVGIMPVPTVIEVQGNNKTIDNFKSRWTPVLAIDGGFQVIGSTGGSSQPLPALVANPELLRSANGAWIQCPDAEFGYAFSGQSGLDMVQCLIAPTGEIVQLTNREQLAGCVIASNTDVLVQFFTGRVGSRI